MNFLQPWMLIALPLALIPIIIHLINQRRFQSTQWAAMMFLLSANRMNRGYAKIRQWLILALRTLVIMAFVLAIGRPIASGLLGGSIAGSVTGRGPANTIVLLDRSPSMQASSEGTSRTKLETGVQEIAEALNTIGTQRVVLIESNAISPRQVASPADLLDLPETGPSDASADVPAMMLAALDYINANQLGQTEVWICSDLRSHDWRGDDGRWSSLQDAFAELGRRVRFRLLAFGPPAGQRRAEPGSAVASSAEAGNRSLRVEDVRLEVSEDEDASAVLISLKITADVEGSEATSQSVPVTLDLDQSRSVVEVEMRSGVGQLAGHRVALPRGQSRGYGSIAIPADFNPADNTYFFTFDTPAPQRTIVVSDHEEIGRVLQLAAEITPEENRKSVAEVVSPRDLAGVSWEDVSLVLWQAALPGENAADSDSANMLRGFVDRGGCVIFFPPESGGELSTSGELFGMQWLSWGEVDGEHPVSSWRGDADLLAATMAGSALPVGTLAIKRLVGLDGDATSLAKLSDGSPLLTRVATPDGGVYFCTTTPLARDSSLATDGVVLYVMIQRALAAGARSLGNTSQMDAGAVPVAEAEQWQRVAGRESALSSENAFVAGVFRERDSGRLIAVNRSVAEDVAATLSDERVDALFQGLPFVRVDRTAGPSSSLVEEIWRAFLIVMLIAMIGEACLCLPRVRSVEQATASGGIST